MLNDELLSEFRKVIGKFDERSRLYEESFLTILGAILTVAFGLIGQEFASTGSHVQTFKFLAVGAAVSGILLTITLKIRLHIVNSLRRAAIKCTKQGEELVYPNSMGFPKFTTMLSDEVSADKHECADWTVVCLFLAAFVMAIILAFSLQI